MSGPTYKRTEGFLRESAGPKAPKIRLGRKVPASGGKERPVETDYFVLDEGLPNRRRIVELYGEEPKRLVVAFSTDDPEEACPYPLQWWGGGVLLCEGDGSGFTEGRRVLDADGALVIGEDGAPKTTRHPCPCNLSRGTKPKCGIKARIRFLIPEVSAVLPYEIATGSKVATSRLAGSLRWYAAQVGRLRGLFFELVREPTKIRGKVHYPMDLRLLEGDAALEAERRAAKLRATSEPSETPRPTPAPAEAVPASGGVSDANRDGGAEGTPPQPGSGQTPDADPPAPPETSGVPSDGGATLTKAEVVRALREPSIRSEVRRAAKRLGMALDRDHPLEGYPLEKLLELRLAVFEEGR